MNVASPPEGILDPQQPYWPANKVGEITWARLKGRLTGRQVEGLSENFTSYVKLSNADADRLIANIKKYGKYPQVNQNDKYGGAYNNEAYQKWLVEEFLEKPFQQQTNQKIEDAAIESRLKEIQEQKKQKAQSFISRPQSTFRPGKTISLKTTKMTGIVPKRSIPSGISQNITPETTEEPTQQVAPKAISSSLGRLTLDLVQIGDNLDKIKEIIEEDYKQTKETNKKEIEEYRKRVANRGRKLPRKDLGDNKKELKDIVKPFVGNFFSGVGGAIRSLAAFNLIDALVRGDWGQVFKSFMGIGITFIPQIGAMVAGAVLKSLLKGFGKNMFGARAPRVPGRMARGPGIGIGKFGKMAALGTGALALGGAFAASQGDEGEVDTSQTRLEEVTAEQKALTSDAIGTITQTDLKKFQTLNEKFEKAVELLLTKKDRGGGGGGGGAGAGAQQTPNPPIGTGEVNMDTSMRGTVTGPQFNNAQLVDLAKKVGATDEEAVRLAAIAKYESGGRPGAHNDNYLRGGGDNSYGLWQINMIGRLGEQRMQEFGITNYEQLKDPVTNAQAALKVLRGSGWSSWTTNPKVTSSDLEEGRRSLKARSTPPPPAQSAPPAQPRPARNPEVSSTPSTSRNAVAVLVPGITGSNGGGAFTNNGSESVASVDPSNGDDVYGRLYRTGWNVVDVG